MRFSYDYNVAYEPDDDELIKAAAVIMAASAIMYHCGERKRNADGSVPYKYINNRSKEELALIMDGAEIAFEQAIKDNDIDISYLYDDLRDYFKDIANEYAREL